jgi:ParB family chromosome partitioning protein
MSVDANPRRNGLGRGLSALLGEVAPRPVSSDGDGGNAGVPPMVQVLPIANVVPNADQPRRHFESEALEELAESIRQRGILQPIVVRAYGTGYQIVAGERRWRAAQRAQLHEIPCIIKDFTDRETLEVAIIENIQRQDLNAIEEAEAYKRLVEDHGHSAGELGKILNKSRSHIANLIRLLELPADVQEAVATGQISMGHARAIVTADDPSALAQEVINRGLSVRDTEKLAKSKKPASAGHIDPGFNLGGQDADVVALERQLADLLGLKVQIAYSVKGGTVTLGYSTLDQLDMICQRLSGEYI